MPGIVMFETTPTFHKIPVADELVYYIRHGTYPPQPYTHISVCYPPRMLWTIDVCAMRHLKMLLEFEHVSKE